MNNVLQCRNLSYSYTDGSNDLAVIKNLDLEVNRGDCVAILGQSGCGKSTLLHLLGGMDKPSAGEVFWGKTGLNNLSETQLASLRAKSLGFVWQFHHLLGDFDALNNVMMPLLIAGVEAKSAAETARTLLAEVGLENRQTHLPSALSGGERQRVAIVRALITQPACVLADEPTGNLDGKNADATLDLMQQLSKSQNCALIIVTHNEKIAAKMERVLTLENGQLK